MAGPGFSPEPLVRRVRPLLDYQRPQPEEERRGLLGRLVGGLGNAYRGYSSYLDQMLSGASAEELAANPTLGRQARFALTAGLAGGAPAGQALAYSREQTQERLRAGQVAAYRKQLGEMMQSGQLTLDRLTQVFQTAVANGDVNLANAAIGWAKTMQNEPQETERVVGGSLLQKQPDGTWKPVYEQPQQPRAPVYGTPEWFTAKERELELEKKFRPPRSAAASGSLREYVDPETGAPRLGRYNPETGRMDPVEGALPIIGRTEQARKAAAFAAFIPEHSAFLDQLSGAPGRIEQALTSKGIREFTNAEQQQLKLAGDALAEAWLRLTTGAAYNEREFQTAFHMFVPQSGDKAEALAVKKRNRERLMQMLMTTSGGMVGTPPRNPFDDLIPK